MVTTVMPPTGRRSEQAEYALLQHLADGAVRSGRALGDELALTRAGVARVVDRLRRKGLTVQALRGQGYRIPGGYSLLDRAVITRAWRATAVPPPDRAEVSYCPTSTSDLAMQASAAGVGVFAAEGQLAGRGRRGQTWQSPLGDIYLSVYYDFSRLPEVPAPVAVGVANALAQALRAEGVQLEVKWPNDLIQGGKKIGGILTELRGEVTGPGRLVIGLGMQQAPIAGTDRDRSGCVGRLGGTIAATVATFEASGIRPLLAGWNRVDALYGRRVTTREGGERREGHVQGVDPGGRLLLSTPEGLEALSSATAFELREADGGPAPGPRE